MPTNSACPLASLLPLAVLPAKMHLITVARLQPLQSSQRAHIQLFLARNAI